MPSVTTIRLSVEEFDVLRAILQSKPELLANLIRISRINISIGDHTRERILDCIGDELASSGVGEDGEINSRGIALDDLIGRFNIAN